ncbi:unnamed protein product [Owenia fusiformis]|uniref:EF-hand domain-containing protein n=1 Tax=Owenia fusiformis TaxID=6347 RepID=A0A8S4PGV9_OWEFU|nr:unnamed protein product [Owenia fusiformis]
MLFYIGIYFGLLSVDAVYGIDYEKNLGDLNIEDEDHIQEHLKGKAKIDYRNMSEKEKAFYFFKNHDLDDDNKLDGLEVFSAFAHTMPNLEFPTRWKGQTEEDMIQEKREVSERRTNNLARQVDRLLEKGDQDDDGYLTYSEYSVLYLAKIAGKLNLV